MSETSYPPVAAQQWVEVSGALLRGIVHTLNNRVTSIEGIGATLEPNEDLKELGALLAAEGERLRALTESIQLVCDENWANAEPCTLADLIVAATQLVRLHPDLREARIDADGADAMPALRVRQRRTVHAIVLAILATAAGGAGDIVVRCTKAGNDRVQMELRPQRPDTGNAERAGSRTAAADALLQVDGGSAALEAGAGSRAVVVSLMSLAGARRVERFGAP
jgi:nitrogen-specific signal transduction histidine kinase